VADRPAQPEGVGTAELIELIDRFESLLANSDASELEVQVGELALLLRKPEVLEPSRAVGGTAGVEVARDSAPADTAHVDEEPSGLHAVVAPLTGIFYLSPAPGAAPYVTVGSQVNTGQVIGLIEAMKLFNEIKSDASGRVARIAAETGTLVKAKQPLIEVEPA
jgi:acetyl-CoA carboxylase biotin carboxyl carrier protein